MKEEGIGFCKTFTTAREASATPSNFLDFSVLKMARGEKKTLSGGGHTINFSLCLALWLKLCSGTYQI